MMNPLRIQRSACMIVGTAAAFGLGAAALAEPDAPVLGPIEAVAPPEHAADKERRIWDAPNFNRRNYSGAVFHLAHAGDEQATHVQLRYQASRELSDDQPANLELRVFDPDDRCVLAADLSQRTPGWYATTIDLTGRPAGRYRFSVTGHHEGLTLGATPARAIGVTGAYALGLPGNVEDQFLYLPRETKFWELWVGSSHAGQTIEVHNDRGKRVRTIEVTSRGVGWKRVRFEGVEGDAVWRVSARGGRDFRVAVLGVPGVMWPTRAAAQAYGQQVRYVGGRRVAHRWQEPMAAWLAERTDADFALALDEPARPDFSRLSDRAVLKLVPMVGSYGPLSQGADLLAHQVIDPDSARVGLFAADEHDVPLEPVSPDWSAPFSDVRYLNTLAWLYAHEAEGINPYYRNPGLLNRIMAGVFQCWLAVGERQAVFSESPDREVLDLVMFFYLEPISSIYQLIGDDLPEPLQQAYRDGLVELFGRYAYHTAFMTNQWGHLLNGLYDAVQITGDPLLAAAYERNLTMMLDHTTGSSNHGQAPAGYYYENGGIDGNYNIMNEHAWGLLYRKSGDERLRDSLERSFALRRHLVVVRPEGQLASARNWNHRTDTGLTSGYPAARLLADLPVPARFVHRELNLSAEPVDLTWIVWRADTARATLEHWWMRSMGPDQFGGGRQALAGALGASLSHHAPPITDPAPLACEEPGPLLRHFGDEFLAGRFGPWYAVLYRGGAAPDRAFGGSGLATLWHEQFGPIVLGHTPLAGLGEPSEAERDGIILTTTDAWTAAGDRVSTYPATGRLSGHLEQGELRTRLAPANDHIFERTFVFAGSQLASYGRHDSGRADDHVMYLPLVVGPDVKARALTPDGDAHALEVGHSATTEQLTWRRQGQTLRMAFEQPVPMTVLRDARLGQIHLRIVRLDFGDEPGKWTIK